MTVDSLGELEVSSPSVPSGSDADHRKLLLHIAVSCPANAGEIARRLGYPETVIRRAIDALIGDGIVHRHEGTLRTTAASRLLAEADPAEIQEIHELVLAELETELPRPTTVLALVESGCRDTALLHHAVRTVNEHPEGGVVLGALTSLAHSHGYDDDGVCLLRASDAARRGHTDLVLLLAEGLVTANSAETRRSAALLAAGAHVQSARLERAAALYRHVRESSISHEGAWGVLTALGRGDLADARRWREEMGEDALTSHGAGLIDLADGLLQSIEGAGAVDRLARSLSALSPFASDVVLPDTPAALAAIVAMSQGEPATAEVLLDRALRARLGGEAGRQRHLLLAAWAHMVQGRLTATDRRLDSLGSAETLGDREQVFYWGLRAGLARRRSTPQEIRTAWREFRDRTLGFNLSLYELLPLGEMMVVAAPLHDGDRLDPMVTEALAILDGLGHPASWSVPLHWSGVQAAFQSEDPAALLPHANALATAASYSSYAAILARAGRVWLDVLRREGDLDAVELSVRELAAAGQVWDASRLASQAALQHPDRDGTLAMMQLAREVSKGHQQTRPTAPGATMLTARELEVARLVLEGHGYRAIGEQLFISPKTVEHHVARIRNRLGASSRGELLEMLHDIVTSVDG
ncbi:hypothetical protein BHE97_13635 [Aeromicrobium sp. PE09-221]|uniref:helix-turn-helix transcriptional regulator n=1 Tax=Aeromicrobium sp. PE09-221 TaxID=1898043 RepID=UPI000B3E43A9|nr:helix-turn-helix transcriptional regulator [Aeromicrobium sp. PE09-221]OUZ08269.1 hypothetical protein BHE97_13635 [Aeromicrobium sp. PE09-221]